MYERDVDERVRNDVDERVRKSDVDERMRNDAGKKDVGLRVEMYMREIRELMVMIWAKENGDLREVIRLEELGN